MAFYTHMFSRLLPYFFLWQCNIPVKVMLLLNQINKCIVPEILSVSPSPNAPPSECTVTLQGSCSDDCSRRSKCREGRLWRHESRLQKKTSLFLSPTTTLSLSANTPIISTSLRALAKAFAYVCQRGVRAHYNDSQKNCPSFLYLFLYLLFLYLGGGMPTVGPEYIWTCQYTLLTHSH